jgi:AbrB family looped-hinge helix DNA binding protein
MAWMQMTTVTVSPKYQVVIPSEVRYRLKLKPGQKVVVLEKDGVVHIVPVKNMKEMKGFVKGINTQDLRDEHDRI